MKIKQLLYVVLIFTVAIIYAYSRYAFNDDQTNLLIYRTINSAFALTGVILLITALIGKFYKKKIPRNLQKHYGNIGVILISFHVLISVKILSGNMFINLTNNNGSLNNYGEYTIVSGVIGYTLLLAFYLHYSSSSKNNFRSSIFRKLKYVLLFVIIIHNLFIVISGFSDLFNVFLLPSAAIISLSVSLFGITILIFKNRNF